MHELHDGQRARGRIGLRVSAATEHCDPCEAVIVDVCPTGCFFRSDADGKVYGATWDQVTALLGPPTDGTTVDRP